MSQGSGMESADALGPPPDAVRQDVVARAIALYCNDNGGIDPEDVLNTPDGGTALDCLQADLGKFGNDSHLSGAW